MHWTQCAFVIVVVTAAAPDVAFFGKMCVLVSGGVGGRVCVCVFVHFLLEVFFECGS